MFLCEFICIMDQRTSIQTPYFNNYMKENISISLLNSLSTELDGLQLNFKQNINYKSWDWTFSLIRTAIIFKQ